MTLLKEGLKTEFKREYVDRIKKTVVAFLNTDGGKVYIGIDDGGESVGVEKADKVLQQLTNAIRDGISPDATLYTTCEIETINDKDVVVAEIERGLARPYYLTDKGIMPQGVYVRQGSSTVMAGKSAIINMIKEASNDVYEDEVSMSQALTFNGAEERFKKQNVAFAKPQRRTLGLWDEQGRYTNLALLLSDQCPHIIKLATFRGTEKVTFQDRMETSGSVLEQMDQAYEYMCKYNGLGSEIVGLYRRDQYEYPQEALREALINAIVHRDYSIIAPTLINIYADHADFVNVGGLYGGVSLEAIMMGVSSSRNPKLANVFEKLELIEAFGTGIRKINEGYADCPVKPEFQVTDDAFKVVLQNRNLLSDHNSSLVKEQMTPYSADAISKQKIKWRENEVLKLAEAKGLITRSDVQKTLEVSQATAILVIREMVSSGKLTKEGNGKNTIYRKALS